MSIKQASKQLNINYSTAKTILQHYKVTGRINRIQDVQDSTNLQAYQWINGLY